jgi:hypothetical protein
MMNLKGLEIGHGLIVVLYWLMSEEAEENHKN